MNTEWVIVDSRNFRSYTWVSDSNPRNPRSEGKIIVNYDMKTYTYEPVKYGMYLSLKDIEESQRKTEMLISGIVANVNNKHLDSTIDVACKIIDFNSLEMSILTSLAGVYSNSISNYGSIERDLSETEVCALVAFILKNHRGRELEGCYKRAASVFTDVKRKHVQTRYENLTTDFDEVGNKLVKMIAISQQKNISEINVRKK